MITVNVWAILLFCYLFAWVAGAVIQEDAKFGLMVFAVFSVTAFLGFMVQVSL